MSYENILYSAADRVARISLNRPRKLNTLTDDLLKELMAALQQADADPDVKVIVLTGEGGNFSAGFSLTGGTTYSIPDQSLDDYHRMIRSMRTIYTTIWNTQKPIVGKIRGYCIAGGCYIQMLCDVSIASDQATFGHPAVTTGGVSCMPMWNWLLGLRKAKELLLTGKMISAAEAEKIGLVNRAVPEDLLDEEVEKTVAQMLTIPLTGLTLTKEGLNTAAEVMGLAATFRTQGHMNALARFGDSMSLDFEGLKRKNQAISQSLRSAEA
jgi:enoyl-CoA hydratase